jgi:DNA-binding transcriptional MerR regulator
VRREFYSIGEVCELLDLKPHVLRYWETQFEELAPTKNRAGNRVYRDQDLERIALIQRLLHEEKFTIEGARERLKVMQEAGSAQAAGQRVVQGAFVRVLREELESLELLLAPADG